MQDHFSSRLDLRYFARFDFKPCNNWWQWRNLILWAPWPKMVGFHNLVGVAIASVSKELALSWKSYHTKVKWHVYSGSYIIFFNLWHHGGCQRPFLFLWYEYYLIPQRQFSFPDGVPISLWFYLTFRHSNLSWGGSIEG